VSYSNRMVFQRICRVFHDSSHMLLGYADGRRSRRWGPVSKEEVFSNPTWTGSWLAEVRPYMTVTDPTNDRLPAEVSGTAYLFRDGDVCFARSCG